MSHFEISEIYYQLNQSASQEGFKCRQFETIGLATYDTVFSLLQFLSHRPKVGLVRHGHAIIESVIPLFLRQQTPLQIKSIEKNINQFIDEIDKETNFVLWSAENEITGEILYSDEKCLEIHRVLTEKKIFSIQIVLRSRQLNKSEILKNNFAILIEVGGLFSSSQAAVFFTDKLKAPSLIGSFQNLKSLQTNQAKFLSSEYTLSKLEGYQFAQKFQPTIQYLKDRKVFIFPNCSGEFLLQNLISQKLVSKDLIFAPSTLPTWILDTFKNWWPEAQGVDLILNMLVVSNQAFILEPQLESEILSIYESNLAEASWTVKP